MISMPPVSREIVSQVGCIIANANFDLRYNNKAIWPALDLLVPIVTEIFRQSVSDKPNGLTRGEILEILGQLNYKTTETLVLVLLTYMELVLNVLRVHRDSLEEAMRVMRLGHIRWQLKSAA